MAKKFLLISELYPSQLKDLSSQGMTISAQEIDKVLEKAKSWSYMIKKNLEELGHTANVLLTNRAFHEHADSDSDCNIYAIIKDRLSREQPHYLIVENPRVLTISELKDLKSSFPGCLFITHHCSALREHQADGLKGYDLVLCCSPEFITNAPIAARNKFLFYNSSPDQGFEYHVPDIDKRKIRCSFFGSIFSGIHANRRKLISYLRSRGLPLDIYSSYSERHKISGRLSKLTRFKRLHKSLHAPIHNLESLCFKLRNPMFSDVKKPLFESRMYSALSEYICTLNVHASFANGFAANMRLFEAASVGTCLITEDYPNLSSLFEPDLEVLTYRSPEECYEKIRYCINHPNRALEIGQNARSRAFKDHRYSKRVSDLIEFLDDSRNGVGDNPV